MWILAAAFAGGLAGGIVGSVFQEWWRNRRLRKNGETLVRVVSMEDF